MFAGGNTDTTTTYFARAEYPDAGKENSPGPMKTTESRYDRVVVFSIKTFLTVKCF